MIRLFLAVLVVCSASVVSQAAEKLNFYTDEFPPFSYQKTLTQIGGPFAEISRSYCRTTGARCSLLSMSWKQAQLDARAGADVFGLFPMGKNADRQQWLHFSNPILKSGYGFFVFNDNDLEFTDISQLRGYKIVTFGPSNTLHFAEKIQQKISGVTLKVLPGMAGMVREMRQPSQYDHSRTAFYGNATILNWQIRQSGGGPVRYAGDERDLLYYFGFPKVTVDKARVDAFNTHIEMLRGSGKLQKILDRWNMELAPGPESAGLVQ